jgi:hypothetical protein
VIAVEEHLAGLDGVGIDEYAEAAGERDERPSRRRSLESFPVATPK